MMRLPFIQQSSTAIHVTEDAAYLVGFMKRRGLLHMTACDREAIVDYDSNGALERLLSRCEVPGGTVAVCLGEEYVRSVIEPADGFDETWNSRMLRRLLPPGSDPEMFVVRTSVAASEEQDAVALVACTPVRAVIDIVSHLNTLGHQVTTVSAVEANVGHAFSFEPAFVNGDAMIVWRSQTDDLELSYSGGRLREMSRRESRYGESLKDARPRIAVRYLPVANSQRDSNHQFPDALPLPVTGAIGLEYAPAVGLAIAQLFTSLPSLNFLEDSAVVAVRNAVDRRDALTLMLGTFGVVFALLLVTSATHEFLESRVLESSMTARATVESRNRAEQARLALTHSTDRLTAVQLHLEARTDAAGMLERIGRAVPPGITLEKLDVVRGPDGAWIVGIRARTRSNEDVALFSGRLSAIAEMTEVELRFVRSDAGKKSGREEGSTFEIQGKLLGARHTGGVL